MVYYNCTIIILKFQEEIAMKVLIISVKAGYGHHSTANALIEEFNSRGIESKMLDTFEYINPKLADSIDNGYLLSTKYLPDIYGIAYDKLDKHDERIDKHSLFAIFSKVVSEQLHNYIKNFNPDFIIGTHPFACMLMTYLQEEQAVNCPTLGIVTDFTIHPLWENTILDYYVIADSLLTRQAEKKGINPNKLLPYGIPVKKAFSKKTDKVIARKELSIENKYTILLIMGSMGFGNIVKEIEEIDKLDIDFQVLCVCGHNDKMYKEIKERKWNKTILAFPFVDNVDVLMDASDFIITKPGGLTTSELLAKNIPAIIMNPIRGQEDRNMEFLVNAGAAIMVTKTFGLDEAIYEILNNPWRLKTLEESVNHLGKPNSTQNLCDFIEEKLKNEQ